MPYATLQDMIDRFGEGELVELTNREPGASTIVESVVFQAFSDSFSEIDGYLRGRYTLPLTEVPSVLVAKACDLARWYLFGSRPTEAVEKRRDAAVAWLVQVSRGQVQLDLGPSGEALPSNDLAEVSTPGRTFTADSLKGFIGR